MKIWVQNFNYHPHELGGAERSARDLASGLARRGHEVEILLSDGSRDYPPAVDGLPLRIVEGLPIGRSPLWEKRSPVQRMAWNLRSEIDPVLLRRLRDALAKARPDCVVINNPAGHGSALLLACRLAGIPFLPVIRDYGWSCAFGVRHRKGRTCARDCLPCIAFSTLRRRLLRNRTCVAISDYVAEVFSRSVPSARVRVIQNALPERFLTTPRPPRTETGRLVFGYIGRLHPTKGVAEILEGWGAAGIHRDGHELLLAGENQGVALPTDAAGMNVHALAPQEAIGFLDRLDVLLVPPTWAEAFGRSVIEGLSRGLYVIGSKNGAIPKLIPPDRGEILETVTGAAIAARLRALAADPTPILRLRALDPEEAVAKFRYDAMIDAYEETIGSLAGSPRIGGRPEDRAEARVSERPLPDPARPGGVTGRSDDFHA